MMTIFTAIISGGYLGIGPSADGTDGQVLTTDGLGGVAYEDAPGAGGGEANTASNQGTDGVGVWDTKVGVDLQFRNIAPASSKISIVLNTKDIDIDLGTVNTIDLADVSAKTGTGTTVVFQTGPTIFVPTLTDPKILDDLDDHAWTFLSGGDLSLNVNCILPLLTASDTFVFEKHTQALTNKTIRLVNNTLDGTKAQFDTACSDGNFAYDAGAHHDGFSDFVANEHIDHTSVTITIAGTSNEIDSSAGAQDISASRTWTIGISDNPIIPGNEKVRIPVGTTAQRPASPADGDLRINSTTGTTEVFRSAAWRDLEAAAGGGEANTASNLGAGVGVWETKSGVDLQFNSLVATSGITISEDDPNDEIDIGIDTAVVCTLTGIQTLTNKTLTSPTINGTIATTGLTVPALTLSGNLTRAANQTIDLTGAATRTLTVQNSTASQVANLDVDGRLIFRNNTSFTITISGTPTANRVHTLPNVANDIITLIAAAQTLTNKTIALGSNTVSGTGAQFDTACTDQNFAFAGGAFHDGFSDFVANEHIDWTSASVAFVTSSTVRADDLLINDTNASHTLTIHWNEDETVANRTLNILVGAADRSLTISGDSDINQDVTTDHSPQFTGINDQNNNEAIAITTTASAINHVGITNAAVGNNPLVSAIGDDTDVDLELASKGDGTIQMNDGADFGSASSFKVSPANSSTIDLRDGNHWHADLISSSGAVTLNITVPGGWAAGTITVKQHGTTPRDITWTPSTGTLKWQGGEPTWSSDAASKERVVSWRWNPIDSVMNLAATGVDS